MKAFKVIHHLKKPAFSFVIENSPFQADFHRKRFKFLKESNTFLN